MNEQTRMFDCIALQAARPRTDMLAGKENGEWHRYSTQEVHDLVYRLAAGLLSGKAPASMALEQRRKIGIISASRPEWIITDLAVQLTGAILVPVYTNSGETELEEIFNEAGITELFAGTKELYDKVLSFRDQVPALKSVYTFDKIEGLPFWKDIMVPLDKAARTLIKSVSDAITKDDISTIIYTSGTTGRPKGVMLTHDNIVTNVHNVDSVINQVPFDNRRALSFLPLNHILEKMLNYIYLFKDISIYYAENMTTIGDNLREVSPEIFVTVPRVLEKVFERIMAAGQALTGPTKFIFFWSLSLANRFETDPYPGFWYRWQLKIADRLVFSKWRAALGGNVKAIVVGGAACQVRLERIFTAAGVTIMEGYGLTETSPVISVNGFYRKDREYGTVGEIIPETEVKIADDGEILCKGPQVMIGYYKQPEQTAEVLQDGWFHTGDIGEFVNGRFLKITDRKKEIFKTSGGKYVAPMPIENQMKESYLIEQMMVLGPGRKFTTAVIVPSFVNLEKKCKENNIPYVTQQQVVKDPRVIQMFQNIIDKYNPMFNHVEQVKKFCLLPLEWTIDGGELTPTGKLKRKVVMHKYENEIEALYNEQNQPDKK